MNPSLRNTATLILSVCGTLLWAQQPDALESSSKIVETAKASDPSTPTRQIPAELRNIEKIMHLTEHDFASMPDNDPRLRTAWVHIMVSSPHFPKTSARLDRSPSSWSFGVAAVLDLRRRGDGATAGLLRLANELEDTNFESSLLYKIAELDGIKLEPYLNYSRKLLQTRVESSNVVSAASLLGRHGSALDLPLLENVATQRSYFAHTIRNESKVLKAHLDREHAASTTAVSDVSNSVGLRTTPPKILASDSNDERAIENERAAPTSSKSWSIIVVLIVAASGLLWLIVKKRN